MSRRDTIIIAVLINAGLLLILFATAMPNKDEEVSVESLATQVAVAEDAIVTKEAPSIVPRDEVDQVLQEWNIKPAAPILVKTDEPLDYISTDKSPGESSAVKQAEPEPKVRPKKPANDSSKKEAQYYVLKKGDNPSKIASKNKIKLEDLLKLNDLNDEKARRLKPGDKLRIQ